MHDKTVTTHFGLAALLLVLGAMPVFAQAGTGITFPPAHRIPAGTQIKVKLLRSLASDTSQVGDPVRVEVVSGDPSGLPAGTILMGQVTEARAGTVKHPGVLRLQFGSGDLASARLVGTKAVASKRSDIGIGAGAGALLGLSRKRKLGDALTGAALGALGGFAVNKAQQHPASDVSLKQGSVISVRLDRPLAIQTQIDAAY